MSYKTKVMVRTGGKEYQPGDILPSNISTKDLNFLKSKKFVELVDTKFFSPNEYYENDNEDDFQENEDDFKEKEPPMLKNLDEIWKIRSKKELENYANSIGCDLGELYEEKSLKELQEKVIHFQEEQF